MSRITVIVTGSRLPHADMSETEFWRRKVFAVLDSHNPDLVVHGGALGVDSMAHAWVKKHGRMALVHFPDYAVDGKGPLARSVRMLEQNPGSVVLGFPRSDSRGTVYTMRRAEELHMVVQNHGSPDHASDDEGYETK